MSAVKASAAASATSSGGIGFCGLLTILFIALKLTHFIDWSWVWVLAPLWIGVVGFIALALIVVAVCFIIAFVQTRKPRRL